MRIISVLEACYSFEKQSEDELSISENDLLVELECDMELEDGWIMAKLLKEPFHSQPYGLIPKEFTKQITVGVGEATVLHDFESTNDDQITVESGQQLIIFYSSSSSSSSPWSLVGRKESLNEIGFVPSSHLSIIIEEKQSSIKSPASLTSKMPLNKLFVDSFTVTPNEDPFLKYIEGSSQPRTLSAQELVSLKNAFGGVLVEGRKKTSVLLAFNADGLFYLIIEATNVIFVSFECSQGRIEEGSCGRMLKLSHGTESFLFELEKETDLEKIEKYFTNQNDGVVAVESCEWDVEPEDEVQQGIVEWNEPIEVESNEWIEQTENELNVRNESIEEKLNIRNEPIEKESTCEWEDDTVEDVSNNNTSSSQQRESKPFPFDVSNEPQPNEKIQLSKTNPFLKDSPDMKNTGMNSCEWADDDAEANDNYHCNNELPETFNSCEWNEKEIEEEFIDNNKESRFHLSDSCEWNEQPDNSNFHSCEWNDSEDDDTNNTQNVLHKSPDKSNINLKIEDTIRPLEAKVPFISKGTTKLDEEITPKKVPTSIETIDSKNTSIQTKTVPQKHTVVPPKREEPISQIAQQEEIYPINQSISSRLAAFKLKPVPAPKSKDETTVNHPPKETKLPIVDHSVKQQKLPIDNEVTLTKRSPSLTKNSSITKVCSPKEKSVKTQPLPKLPPRPQVSTKSIQRELPKPPSKPTPAIAAKNNPTNDSSHSARRLSNQTTTSNIPPVVAQTKSPGQPVQTKFQRPSGEVKKETDNTSGLKLQQVSQKQLDDKLKSLLQVPPDTKETLISSSAKISRLPYLDKTANPTVHSIRTWNDRSGSFSTEAVYVGMEQGMVALRKSNGVKISVPIDTLSLQDIEHLKTFEHSLQSYFPTSYNNFDWLKFLVTAGIPHLAACNYAQGFVREKLDSSSIPYIDRSILKSFSIPEGDIIKIIKTCQMYAAHLNQTQHVEHNAYMQNMRSLEIQSNLKQQQTAFTQQQNQRYQQMALESKYPVLKPTNPNDKYAAFKDLDPLYRRK